MNFVEMFHKERRWIERATLLSTYHRIQCMKDKSWTIKKTAKEFKISIGHVSEDLSLVKSMEKYKDLGSLSRNKALERIRKDGR